MTAGQLGGRATAGRRAALGRLVSTARVSRLLDSAPPVDTPRALANIGSSFYLAGGLIAFLVSVPSGAAEHRLWLQVLGAGSTIAGLVVARTAARIPVQGRRLMNFSGTAIVLLAILLAGPGPGAAALFWLFCFVPMDSFFFFPWRWAIPMLCWGLLATAIATFWAHLISPLQWLVMCVVAVVVSFAVGWLIRSAADSEWDQGTSMLTRRGFDRELELRCQQAGRLGRTFSLATLAVDRLDQLSERLGSLETELLVRTLAARWTSVAPPAARWARIRDGEFAVLWTEGPGFEAYLDRLCAAAQATHPISIGLVDYQDGDSPAELLSNAMRGLSYSQRNGGNQLNRQGLIAARVAELRSAIWSGQLEVLYQPIVDVADELVIGAEALVRWMHPVRGMLLPDDFIGLAEQSGLIGLLGERVLKQACRDAASWHLHRCDQAKVAVNVAGQQLHDPAFVGMVTATLAESGLPAWRLVLEVTESSVAGDDEVAINALRRLRKLGVRVAIDDFGTGFSNLSRLSAMPVDLLKLDRSFIEQLETSTRARALLRGLIGMANALGLRAVVEGIESQQQARIVAAMGAHEGQGWLWGHPAASDQFARDTLRLAG